MAPARASAEAGRRGGGARSKEQPPPPGLAEERQPSRVIGTWITEFLTSDPAFREGGHLGDLAARLERTIRRYAYAPEVLQAMGPPQGPGASEDGPLAHRPDPRGGGPEPSSVPDHPSSPPAREHSEQEEEEEAAGLRGMEEQLASLIQGLRASHITLPELEAAAVQLLAPLRDKIKRRVLVNRALAALTDVVPEDMATLRRHLVMGQQPG